MTSEGTILIISGPSGCGKSTVLAKVMKELPRHFFSVSATTRAPRIGEQDGVDYCFIKREKFEQMLAQDAFLEHAEYVGNYYGTPKAPVLEHAAAGDDVILDIEVQGAEQVMKKLPQAVSVFLVPPSLEELEHRLRGRSSESEEHIKNRLLRAAEELKLTDKYDYVVVNDNVDDAVSKILDIIKKSK